jgi:hypothetical protein
LSPANTRSASGERARVDEVFKFRFENPGLGEPMRITKDCKQFEIAK